MKTSLLTLLLMILPLSALAQDEDEYRMEIGGGLGLVSYQGDFNGSITKNMQPAWSLVLRRVFNPYMAMKCDLMFGKLKGNSTNVTTWYPEYNEQPYEFSSSLFDLGLTYEYNFWPYGTGRDYRGAKKLTPFIFLGLGMTYADCDGGSAFTANLPLGIGVKYKIGKRINLGVEWAMHFSLSDKLDGVKDPYGIESTGMFKNTDCYSSLKVTLTYSFLPKCIICNKDD